MTSSQLIEELKRLPPNVDVKIEATIIVNRSPFMESNEAKYLLQIDRIDATPTPVIRAM